MTGLVDAYGKPVSTARYVPGNSREAESFRVPFSGWRGPMLSGRADAARERMVMQRRAGDLAANDWAAGSALQAITMNAVGTGLLPKAAVPSDMLDIASEEAARAGKEMEWAWEPLGAGSRHPGPFAFSRPPAVGAAHHADPRRDAASGRHAQRGGASVFRRPLFPGSAGCAAATPSNARRPCH